MAKLFRTGAIMLGVLCWSMPVRAESQEALLELVRSQAAAIEALQARIAALEQAAAAPSAMAPAEVTWPGGPELVSADGRFSARLQGRVLADHWAVASDRAGVDYPGGSALRESRFGLSGRLGARWAYKLEVDFAGDAVTVKDAYLRYLGLEHWTVTIGNQRPAFSLEHLTGQQNTLFMERALPTLFGFSESLGIGVATRGEHWSLAVTAFGEAPGTELDGDEGYGVAARATFAPIKRRHSVFHLGASGQYKKITADQALRLQQRPEVRIFGQPLLDTGTHPAQSSRAAGVEFLGIRGPFTLQGEYLRHWANYRQFGRLSQDGAYMQASWVVTGESRAYDPSSGLAARVLPAAPLGEGGWGALELATRFSTLNLTDGPVAGGSADNFTLGVNWHPTRHTRLMFNWVHFKARGNHAVRPYGEAHNKGHAFGARAQVDW